MVAEKVCGTCIYGGDALDRHGNIDPNYVLCQIKEAENRNRKPDRYQTLSAVSRMHFNRDACLHWRENVQVTGNFHPAEEAPLPMAMLDLDPVLNPAPPEPPPIQAPPQAPEIDRETLNQLQTELIQKNQMIDSLQFQMNHLSEELTHYKEKAETLEAKLKHAIYFDPALSGGDTNYFDLLGVTLKDRPEDIKRAYYLKMKTFHPDRFVMITRQINLAYETLTDPDKRMQYLQKLKLQNGQNSDI